MLLYSYKHASGDLTPLDDSTLPIDPVNGYSHVASNLVGYTSPPEIDALRFWCISDTNSGRLVHFTTVDPVVKNIAVTGSQTGNGVGVWIGPDVTLLPDHTGMLPIAINAGSNTANGGFWEQPFRNGGNYHWAIRLGGTRFECDQ